jgi:hypothetical protein
MEKIRMHKKMAMTGKSPVGKMGGGMMKPTGYKKGGMAASRLAERMKDKDKVSQRDMANASKMKMGGGVKKPVTVKEITPKGRKGVLIYKGKAKDYKPVGKNK